jgi:hypothetical protein
LKAALELLERARRDWKPPAGPVVLTEEYLRRIEQYENLPEVQSGVDKTWVGLLLASSERTLREATRRS